MAQEEMELDMELLPSLTIMDGNILRRSSSAPSINSFRSK
ncbi:PREDICTED: protein FAM122C [Elephantulus edwardii]|nr:PREDICTED: protein FAM122C [Elephantulus edwardii]